MSQGQIGMSVAEATNIASRFVSTNTEAINGIETDMRNMVNTLREVWQGSSVERYEAMCTETHSSFVRIIEIINELGDAVTQAAAAFEELDNSL